VSLPVIKPQSESASRPGRLGFVYSTLVVRCAARLGTSQQQLLLLERCQGNSLHKNRLRVILFFPPRRVANERNVKGQWITRQIVSFTSFTPPPPPISISDTLFSTSCLFLFSFRPVSSKPAVSLYTRQFLSSFFISGCVLCTPKGEKNRKDSRNESTFLRVRFFFFVFFPRHTLNVRRGSRTVSLLHFCL
jgi:hypothetical protein